MTKPIPHFTSAYFNDFEYWETLHWLGELDCANDNNYIISYTD